MTETDRIAEAWSMIERVLSEHVPDVAATLRAGASDEDLARLAEAVGPLPDAFAASLRIHDGQDDPSGLLQMFDYLSFLSIDQMLEDHQMRLDIFGDDVDADDYAWMTPDKVRTIPNSRGWIRFTDGDGEGHALDLDPLPNGQRGQVIWLPGDGPTPAPLAPSYGAWLTDLARRLDAGAFTVDDKIGIPTLRLDSEA